MKTKRIVTKDYDLIWLRYDQEKQKGHHITNLTIFKTNDDVYVCNYTY